MAHYKTLHLSNTTLNIPGKLLSILSAIAVKADGRNNIDELDR